MLVLSRRVNEKIILPDLETSIEILRITSNAVRLGVAAPESVRVLREELAEPHADAPLEAALPAPRPRLSHAARNRLNVLNMALVLLEKQLARGRTPEAATTLAKAREEFTGLIEELSPASERAPTAPQRILRRALVVEDNAQESELMATILRMNGFRVDTAHDGCDALDYLSTHKLPDVVLLDMQMPRCDGPTTISRIRQDPTYKDIKVFAVSGYHSGHFDVPVGPGGVDRWFTKPVNPETLIEEMKQDIQASSCAPAR